MKTKTNEQIFESIRENGFISEKDIQLLKNRSNRAQRDLIDYDFMESYTNCYGIPITEEQGAKGLKWLKKFIRKDGGSRVFGFRELEIINTARPGDFVFRGFYDCGRYGFRNYVPVYGLGAMEYVPLSEPYIVG